MQGLIYHGFTALRFNVSIRWIYVQPLSHFRWTHTWGAKSNCYM